MFVGRFSFVGDLYCVFYTKKEPKWSTCQQMAKIRNLRNLQMFQNWAEVVNKLRNRPQFLNWEPEIPAPPYRLSCMTLTDLSLIDLLSINLLIHELIY